MSLKAIDMKELKFNPMTLIGKEWMLVSAGNEKAFNTMTAQWGHLGAIWNGDMPTSIIYLRPQRYTREFVDKEDYYTLSFFDESYKKDLLYLGTHSGRSEDKLSKTKLTPLFSDETVYFKEAKLVFVCRKVYRDKLREEGFIDQTILKKNYPERDFHYVYIGEIVKAYVNDEE